MSEEKLDLRIRLFYDGGPLFNQLTGIQNSSARNTRALQLMYLGLLVESGWVNLNGSEPPAAAKPSQSVAQQDMLLEEKRETATLAFDADDLAATFGVSTP